MSDASVATVGIEQVAAELRSRERFLLTAHEGPDGDALGSLLGMHHLLGQLGKDSVMFMAAKEFPLPIEYRFLPLEEVFHEPPADMADRTVVFLDCGNIDRMPVEFLSEGDNFRINIDHHHDNTHFGTVNLVVPEASCTAEIIWDLMGGLDLRPSCTIADALYVGLITDTGRFMYENTGRRAHLMAADLIDAGVDVHELYRRVYEGVPYGKLALLARGLANVERYDDGRLTVTALTATDFHDSGAEESYSEGVIDHLRAVQGTAVAALIRERINNGGGSKVSLRASDDRVDVSAIARALGGGGHRQAAGFTTELSHEELVRFLRKTSPGTAG